MNSLRITCITSSLGAGGAERNLVRLAEWLYNLGHHVTILTLNYSITSFYEVPTGIVHKVTPREAHISNRWFRLHRFHRQFKILRKFILETNPEIIISFIDTSNVSVLMALHSSKFPVIVSERTDPRQHKLLRSWLLLRRLYYPRAAHVVLVTQDTLLWARTKWPKWKASFIPNAILPPVVSQLGARPKWFSAKNIVAMGRLDKWKGFDILLQAFARIAIEFPDWNLTIMGEGPERSKLEKLSHSLGLEGRVQMPGLIANPSEVLSQADLFVHSSLYEGFPNAIAEAMACGLPVISFDCPSGPKEIIRNNIDGILVPVGDMNGLSETMRKLMADDIERKRLAIHAPDVLERFSSQRIIGMWQTVIKDALRRAMHEVVE